MLKYRLGKDAFDDLSDLEKTFYKADGDQYQIEIEGVVDKARLDEFRSSNVELLKEAEKFKGVDLDQYRDVMEQQRKIRDKELIDKGDFDTLLTESTNSMRSDFEAKIATLTEDNESITKKYNALVTKHEIEGAATKAFTEHKISPDAHDAIMAQIKGKFSFDGTQVIAKNGDVIEAGENGNLTVAEFVKGQPEMFKVQNIGGGGQGATGKPAATSVMTSTERIAAALKKRG